jgi:hypothetical protein
MHHTLSALRTLDEGAALRSIVEGTATHTGDRFFQTLVESLARALGTHGAWVTEYLPDAVFGGVPPLTLVGATDTVPESILRSLRKDTRLPV